MIQSNTEDGYLIEVPEIIKNYKCIRVIGFGSTSIVVLVEDKNTKKQYSAKIMARKDMEERKLMKSIEKETTVLKDLDCQYVVKVYDSFNIKNDKGEELIVIIMDYCENGDLLTYALDKKFKTIREKKATVLSFLKGVKFLHDHQISHGDIKADNILLTKDLTSKLCDFGYCRTSTVAGNDAKNGTLYYAAPELFKKGQFDTLKTDIWAIGVTLYAISELQFPFKDGDQNYIIKQIVSGNLSIRPEVDQKLRTIVESCTQMNPQNRPTIDDLIKHDYFYIEDETFENKNNFYVPTKMEDFSQITELNDFNNEDQLYEEIPFEPTFEL